MSWGSIRRMWVQWVGGYLALLTLVVGLARGDDPVEPGTLSGRVVDAEWKGIVGAAVRFQYSSREQASKVVTQEVRADAEGRFHSPPLEPTPTVGLLTVMAEGFGHCVDQVDRVAIFPGRDTDFGVIRLDRGRVFVGRVVEADGSPRAGVTVVARVARHDRGHSVSYVDPGVNPVTDADGRFRTVPLPVGQLSLAVQVPGRRWANRTGRPVRPGPADEDLGEIRLTPDVPIAATVRDEAGRPVAGAAVAGTVGLRERTDIEGRFTVRGFGPDPRVFVTVNKFGFVQLQGYLVGDERGLRFDPTTTGPNPIPPPSGVPARDLALTLKRAGIFEGVAVDAATGRPVPLAGIVPSLVERSAAGNPILTPAGPRSRTDDAGRFRVPFQEPGEFHLAITADGYRPAAVLTPRTAEMTTIGGIVARLQPARDDAPEPAAQVVAGTVTRDGRPVPTGWATLATRLAPGNAPNAEVCRGRMVPNSLGSRPATSIRDGAFSLDVPNPGDAYTLVITEPGQAPTTLGPFPLRSGEARTVAVACPAGARVQGRVVGVPADWRGAAWVVAFDAAGLRLEAPVAPDGSYALPPLPPGEYGLKAGHDAYEDAEVYPGFLARDHPESYQILADPWKRAVRVRVEAGQDVPGLVVPWPE